MTKNNKYPPPPKPPVPPKTIVIEERIDVFELIMIIGTPLLFVIMFIITVLSR